MGLDLDKRSWETMSGAAHRILCIGTDPTFLEIRCLVLASAGYQAEAATLPADYQRLRSGRFDLVILSTLLAEAQGGVFKAALPAHTQALTVEGFLFPADLLNAVARKLSTGQAPPLQAELTQV